MPDARDAFLEEKTRRIGMELLRAIHRPGAQPEQNEWVRRVMDWCLSAAATKGRVLRFVDVLPSLPSDKALVDHLRAYFPFSEHRIPLALRTGALASSLPFSARTVGRLTRQMAEGTARQFLAGETPEEIAEVATRLEANSFATTFDVLGEAVTSHREADAYRDAYLALLRSRPDQTQVSIKLSALSARFDPLAGDRVQAEVVDRLRPLLMEAKRRRQVVTIDAETYEQRPLTLQILKRLLLDPAGVESCLGLAFQAYFTDSRDTLEDLLAWLDAQNKTLSLRLVKGAYWDSETARAVASGWPVPVWPTKAETDACFESLTERLLARPDRIRLAIGSHNVRSVARAMALFETAGATESRPEFQLLFGMADSLKAAIRDRGYPVRVYVPVGPLLPGMAYLVRRILENTSNESFLRQEAEGGLEAASHLLAAPRVDSSAVLPPAQRPADFRNEPYLDFSRAEVIERFHSAISSARSRLGADVPLLVGGKEIRTERRTPSLNPARLDERIGEASRATRDDVDEAVRIAVDAHDRWNQKAAAERGACLHRAAERLRAARWDFAALEVLEAGKTWREADADVSEAIDFMDFYASAIVALPERHPLLNVPGESNTTHFHGRGVAAIIAPWNFPLAILTGMTAAALVTGNSVLIKPSGETPVIAYQLARLMLECGVPEGALAFLPGAGAEVGAALVRHPRVDLIAFTGSRDVGLSLIREAGDTRPGQVNVKKVVAEMGGKNAIIVDEDADLDEAVMAITASAFGYAGQKCSACSRLIVLDSVYDRLVDRLVEATRALRTDDPTHPDADLGPVISPSARNGILSSIQKGKHEARLLFEGSVQGPRDRGCYLAPHIFVDAPVDGVLAREEIFGPVLTVFRAGSFDEAIALANNSEYALTAGVFSRHPGRIEQAKRSLACGNLYINRRITGAYVGRQPFGGVRMSGVGTKAGGHPYLLHFLTETVVTENTLRHGFPL